MPRRFTRTAACALLAAALATDARAQAPSGPETASSGDRLAVTLATGSALGLLYHLTPRLAIHPELNVSRQQVEGFPSSTAVNGAVAVRFYPSRSAARTRPFIAGRYGFGRIIRDGEDLVGPQALSVELGVDHRFADTPLALFALGGIEYAWSDLGGVSSNAVRTRSQLGVAWYLGAR